MEIVMRLVCLLILSANSWRDLRERRIFLWPTLVLGMTGAGLLLGTGLWGRTGVWVGREVFLRSAPGLILLSLGFLSSWKIGGGDGICVWAVGCWMRGAEVWSMICISAILLFFAGGIQILRKRRSLPFLPVLWAAWMIEVIFF